MSLTVHSTRVGERPELTCLKTDRTIQSVSFKRHKHLTQVNKDSHCILYFYPDGCSCSLGLPMPLYSSAWNIHKPKSKWGNAFELCLKKRSLWLQFNALFDFHLSNQKLSLRVKIYGTLTSRWKSYGRFIRDCFFLHLVDVVKWKSTLSIVLKISLLLGFNNLYCLLEKTQFNSTHPYWALTFCLMLE